MEVGMGYAVSALEQMGDELVEAMRDYIENGLCYLGGCITSLETYVKQRQIPTPLLASNGLDEIGHAIEILGCAMELRPKEAEARHTRVFMPKWALRDQNPLQELLDQAELCYALDFEEVLYRDSSGASLKVLTLDDLATLTGQRVSSVRNATGAHGDLTTVHLENVTDRDGNRLSQTVFVEYEVALQWLQKKNAYAPLREETETESMLTRKIAEYGPRFEGKSLPDFLKISEQGELATYYAPFEHINKHAKIVLCGITPGAQQAEIALNTFARALNEGKTREDALRLAKATASFAGPMRTSLVKMLDHVGLHTAFGLTSCSALFGEHADLVHYTSALRNPVFFRGQNYTGNPLMLKEFELRYQVETNLKQEVIELGPDTLYIPLGPKPDAALQHLAGMGLLKSEHILSGIPHPSGANAERIKYFCEEKDRNDLSSRTNADALDAARASVKSKIKAYAAQR